MKNQTNQKEQYPVPETKEILVQMDMRILQDSQVENPTPDPEGGD